MGTIQSVKISMGWQSALQRPRCAVCKHCDEQREDRVPPFDTQFWECRKGGFKTGAMALCEQFEARK